VYKEKRQGEDDGGGVRLKGGTWNIFERCVPAVGIAFNNYIKPIAEALTAECDRRRVASDRNRILACHWPRKHAGRVSTWSVTLSQGQCELSPDVAGPRQHQPRPRFPCCSFRLLPPLCLAVLAWHYTIGRARQRHLRRAVDEPVRRHQSIARMDVQDLLRRAPQRDLPTRVAGHRSKKNKNGATPMETPRASPLLLCSMYKTLARRTTPPTPSIGAPRAGGPLTRPAAADRRRRPPPHQGTAATMVARRQRRPRPP